ncbi:hypothetical protein MMC14_001915 [Varicellaria rhodocarpa]|nr:hypothetical protein [Varicellaria rhodocarpa]
MIIRKYSPPNLTLSTPSPEESPRCSVVLSDCDADDEGTMSAEEYVPSRPWSGMNYDSVVDPVGPYCPRRPTLQDVLTNAAPPPWSLSAFTAYLSQNHCLETLEFTMDSQRYRKRFDKMVAQMAGMPVAPDMEECVHVRMLWQRLLKAYIMPNSPRELNLPGHVRDRLLSLPNHTVPPPPEELEPAVKIVFELMDESVLIPFLNEVSPSRGAASFNNVWNESDENLYKRRSSDEPSHHARSRQRASPPSSTIDIQSPHSHVSYSSGIAHSFNRSRLSAPGSSSSVGSGDTPMSDDSGSPTSLMGEPMTPPTTPPSSDIGSSSPRNKNDNAFKKMIGRLGTKKKSSSRIRRGPDESS